MEMPVWGMLEVCRLLTLGVVELPAAKLFLNYSAGVVCEFSARILTMLLPPSVKAIFYHSALVLFIAVIIGRQVWQLAVGEPRVLDPWSLWESLVV